MDFQYMIVVQAIATCAGLVIMFLGARSWVLGMASRNWPRVPGKVTAASYRECQADEAVRYEVDIRYRYTVGGRTYTGTRLDFRCFGFARESDASSLVTRYGREASVNVIVHPRRPDLAVLDSDAGGSIVLFLCGAVFVLMYPLAVALAR